MLFEIPNTNPPGFGDDVMKSVSVGMLGLAVLLSTARRKGVTSPVKG